MAGAEAAAVLALPAVANLGAAAGLASSLQAQLETGGGNGPVRVDASALQVYDTSTVALLMQLRRLANQAGRAFELQAPPAQLVQLATLYGVDELLCTPPGG